MKTTPNPPHCIDYKSLYHWAPDNLLAETSKITSFEDIEAYKEGESSHKTRIFGKEHDRFVKALPYRKGEPVCIGESADSEDPFFYVYSTVFKRLKLRLPFTRFEHALLTKVNVAPAQLHPIAGHSSGPFLFSTTTLAIRHWWMSFYTSLRLRV